MPKKAVPVVAAFVRDVSGRILLARRPPGKARAGLWEFPGGKVKPEETPEEALKRELQEELGVSAEVGQKLASVTHDYPEVTIELSLYEALIKGPVVPQEGQEVAWFKPRELFDLELCPADRKLLKILETCI
ncbi:(deoxy)nucleoside triphosphate pyrophosphohydrolase [Thermosulfurimonas dismutans]|uniref:8-oxo-dGTP diphosphatase n=1 Tax=Thermosulfurimonas dismutans TaxID=999894 RepID=A0A179D3J3_9BACT|nr:(deoxy)nucleoside triphosphate pyrophosphohydrolase [Thermosulfurimonas dismutans]OAQ20553.1 5-methyl-dCTP pyrophosphohydrolase [Thermosulfurimonas dismutans]